MCVEQCETELRVELSGQQILTMPPVLRIEKSSSTMSMAWKRRREKYLPFPQESSLCCFSVGFSSLFCSFVACVYAYEDTASSSRILQKRTEYTRICGSERTSKNCDEWNIKRYRRRRRRVERSEWHENSWVYTQSRRREQRAENIHKSRSRRRIQPESWR